MFNQNTGVGESGTLIDKGKKFYYNILVMHNKNTGILYYWI